MDGGRDLRGEVRWMDEEDEILVRVDLKRGNIQIPELFPCPLLHRPGRITQPWRHQHSFPRDKARASSSVGQPQHLGTDGWHLHLTVKPHCQ
ncbi:hypothetical protein U9M48_018066, partial [Paspalum notatum var. saurae]